MGKHNCLGHHVDCYCVNQITIGAHSTVSQYSFLCTASHDYTDLAMPLTTVPNCRDESETNNKQQTGCF